VAAGAQRARVGAPAPRREGKESSRAFVGPGSASAQAHPRSVKRCTFPHGQTW